MPRTNSSNWSVNDQITAARLQDFNEDIDDIYTYGDDRGRIRSAVSGTALKIDIAAFAWRVGSTSGQYAGATDISVTNTATNYVEIDSTGTIQINTTGWTGANARLGTVTCSGGVITAISIWKVDVIGGSLGSSSTTNIESISGNRTLISTDKLFQVLDASSTDRNVILDTTNMADGNFFYVRNASATALLTVKQGSTVLDILQPNEAGIFAYNGTNWYVILSDNDDSSIFGDGSDGTVTLGSNTTITRDMYYMNLDLSTYTLNTAGYKVFVKRLLTGSGKIKAPTGGNGGNGGNASSSGGYYVGGSGGTAGTSGAGVTLPASIAGKAGGDGATNAGGVYAGPVAGIAGTTATNSFVAIAGVAGGSGGTSGGSGGGAGASGGSGASASTDIGDPKNISEATFFSRWLNGVFTQITGAAGSGSGGGGGAANANGGAGGGGGGSGANGGFWCVFANMISGSFTIESTGGNGGNGGNGIETGSGGGGGGGGQGGCGILVYKIKTLWSGSYTLTGGTKGTGGTGTTSGSDGVNGNAGDSLEILF